MVDFDLPNQSAVVRDLSSDFRADMAIALAGDLFSFSKTVMGFKDMTAATHGPMCVFLDTQHYHDDGTAKIGKACGMPRATFKSSIGTVSRPLQQLCQNRNRTKAIFNEAAKNAQNFLRAIRQTAENNSVFRTFYSDLVPKDTKRVRWNDTELDFNRDITRPEASISAHGITSTIVSQHWDDLTFDDIVSEEAAASEKVMKDATDRAKKFRSLMVHPTESTLTIMFTRWGFADAYSTLFRDIGDDMSLMIRGAIENGKPIFPERLGLKVLARIRREIGEYMFSCLYMNNPRNAEVQDFNVDDLRFFDLRPASGHLGETLVLLDAEGREFRRYYLSQCEVYATVDLAPAEKATSDRNAVSVVAVTPSGEACVLASWARRCDPLALMTKIFYFHRRFQPKVWGIEDVAYQKAFKYFVKDYAEREDLYLNVKPIGALGRKETRIRGLQPLAATHRLYLRPTQHVLRSELADFPLGEHDDAADSLSMQLQLWENQMSARRWAKYRETEQRVISEIERERQISSFRYLPGDVPDVGEDFGDLVPAFGPVSGWTFPQQ